MPHRILVHLGHQQLDVKQRGVVLPTVIHHTLQVGQFDVREAHIMQWFQHSVCGPVGPDGCPGHLGEVFRRPAVIDFTEGDGGGIQIVRVLMVQCQRSQCVFL